MDRIRLALVILAISLAAPAAAFAYRPTLSMHQARNAAQMAGREDVYQHYVRAIGRPHCRRGRTRARAYCDMWEYGLDNTYQLGATLTPNGEIHGKKVDRLRMRFYLTSNNNCVDVFNWNINYFFPCEIHL